MKMKINEIIEIPSGIVCEYKDGFLKGSIGKKTISKKIDIHNVEVVVKGNQINLSCNKTTKREFKRIKSFVVYAENIFKGLQEDFVYKLESANVHFPMTFKLEGQKLVINNFLGEKVPRMAKIMPNVEVVVKGNQISISSPDKEAAGQTAANFEKATLIRKRDRRIFQDGIYIVEKPGGKS